MPYWGNLITFSQFRVLKKINNRRQPQLCNNCAHIEFTLISWNTMPCKGYAWLLSLHSTPHLLPHMCDVCVHIVEQGCGTGHELQHFNFNNYFLVYLEPSRLWQGENQGMSFRLLKAPPRTFQIIKLAFRMLSMVHLGGAEFLEASKVSPSSFSPQSLYAASRSRLQWCGHQGT